MDDRLTKKLWHTNRKRFITEFSILQTVNSDGSIEHTYFEFHNKTRQLERLCSCHIVEVPCTGLKDKNGKLIYEGDIIQFPDPYKENTLLAHTIKWESHFTHTGYWLNSDFTKLSEVIGNIYEDEEILKCIKQ